jgi:Fic family protein
MESAQILEKIQADHQDKLILTGLAALQDPTVLTRQLTFFNPSGGKKDYRLGSYHVFIRRAPHKKLGTKDHLLFIARHIELYANEIDLLTPVLQDISLKDFEKNDRTWRIFAYLRNRLLNEPIPDKKIGRRYIDFGDIRSPIVVNDTALHIRDALLVPNFRMQAVWSPRVDVTPDPGPLEAALADNKAYFRSKKMRPLFHRFQRYASRLESAASAKIEGYDARVEESGLSERLQKRMKADLDLRAHLNMDNLHRDLAHLSKETLSLDLLLHVQKAIVKETWRNREEMADKTPGSLRPFDEVIVDRGAISDDNVVYVAPRHEDVGNLLMELIAYYHRERSRLCPLDLAAVFKAQLTIIHPFGDGNGRLTRWCFLYILIREKFIENVHQAPISHIFLQERNRYYEELLKADKPVMEEASYSIDPTTHRYRAHYSSPEIYRTLDYSSWLAYVHDAFIRALGFSVEEHRIFEKVQTIFSSFEKRLGKGLTPAQQHEANRAIDIGLKAEWGKKTEKRLLNNGFDESQVRLLKDLALS